MKSKAIAVMALAAFMMPGIHATAQTDEGGRKISFP